MNLTPPQRPNNALQRVCTILKPESEELRVPPRKYITWKHKGHQQIYFFLDGQFSILRESDKLLLVTVFEPYIFGIAEMIQPVNSHIMRTESEVTLLRISAEKAHQLIQQHQLWEDIASILAYNTAYLVYRDVLTLQQGTYNIICNHLRDMILLPEEMRSKITILKYIQDRTHLSRSSILNIISSLNKNHYISYRRGGYLISVNDLPDHL
ncbi:winged helix-turn-helix transcriptional regulator [Shimwellia blattae]|uniref:Putative cNMP-binding family protein n=1 Tax=Shimwellia blattae (strain ATCC 29907 / DSM 4481 / JCM 1650 / NBRC 105725 / CDC 9005-74) TaxID=630626 RepID=I2BEB4_SHIBC|nr:winged helix-turn-helix transcriptional regulator [Shimwellia blattae]AFJ48868.1 putative cNMP-binding family protein [Shimwellia blattae DSM 4481 = NBRC 105725]GAB81859.1 hypothetical protein EB105725_17_01080 [Shimwellia blattae DSM 4481 = NBRC 105725]